MTYIMLSNSHGIMNIITNAIVTD